MLWIERMEDSQYRITDGTDAVRFSKEKFEDLYYAVPTHATQFYRLLVEELPTSLEERAVMNRMITSAGDREINLDLLQEQVKKLPAP